MEGSLFHRRFLPGKGSRPVTRSRSVRAKLVCLVLASVFMGTTAWSQDAPPPGPLGMGESLFIDSFESDDPPPPTPCPPGYSPPLSGATVTWQSQTGQPWPEPAYWEDTIGIPKAGYLAIEFNTGSQVNRDGGVKTIPNISTQGSRLGAFSPCAGDFSEHLTGTTLACTEYWSIGGTMSWSTEALPDTRECPLDPNTTYYLNLTFTDGVDPASDRCVSNGPCQTILRVFY